MIEVGIKNFGPIRSGRVKLKPLTIFVGPNNSGKSYFATLLYALCRGAWLETYGWAGRFYEAQQDDLDSSAFPVLNSRDLSTLIKSIADTWSQKGIPSVVTYRELPSRLQTALNRAVKSHFERFQKSLIQELCRNYGTLLPDLNRKAQSAKHFTLRVSHTEPSWSLLARQSDERLQTEDIEFDWKTWSLDLKPFIKGAPKKQIDTSSLVAHFILYLQGRLSGPLVNSLPWAYYFPAARSGILQSHKALASFLVSQSSLAGLQRVEVPQLPGVITDFIGELLTLQKTSKASRIWEIALRLENSVVQGQVSLEASKTEYPQIYYRPKSGQFPLHRTSSMVSELAPIVLFLKHKVRPNNLLIIEEPESHLHPANQRKLAETIAELVNADVTVLLTTHSDYFLSQVSNFVRASQFTNENAAEPALPNLQAAKVACYLFEPTEDGNEVKELNVTAEEGIPDDEFSHVAESLYKQTVQLQS